MAGAESVEEVQERNAALDGGKMCHSGEILGFLDGAGGEHRKTCLTAGHYVLMVSEYGESVGCQRTCGNMENCRKHFACNLVHVGYHQKKSLGCSVGGGEGSGLKGTVNGSGGAAFALEFSDFHGFSPKVLFPVCSPLVDILRHRGGRCDRVDGSMLAEEIRNVRDSGVAITSDEFLFFSHNRYIGYLFVVSGRN